MHNLKISRQGLFHCATATDPETDLLKTSFMQHLSDIFHEWPVYLVHMLLLFSTILASHQVAPVWIWSLNLMISRQGLFHCATTTDLEIDLLKNIFYAASDIFHEWPVYLVHVQKILG